MTAKLEFIPTQGEWWCNGIPVVHSDNGDIAVMSGAPTVNRKMTEAVANAFLCAAAPDMLVILEDIYGSGMELNETQWDAIQTAITKAKGDFGEDEDD